MYLSGKVERVKVRVFFPFWIIVLTSLLFSSRVYSDFSQVIMGDPDLDKKSKLKKGPPKKRSPFITDEVVEELGDKVSKKELDKDPYIYDENSSKEDPLKAKITVKDRLLQFGQEIPRGRDEPVKYFEASNREIFLQASNQGRRSFGISYLKDMSSYIGKNDAFSSTYSNYADAVRVGLLSFSFKKFIKKGGVNFAYRINGSVGLNQAPGLFADGGRAEKNISLWLLPIDLAFDMEVALGEKFKLELQGGPSICGIFQNRHDKGEGEDQKRLGQVGFGFVAGVGLKTNLMQFKRTSSIDLLSSLSASDYYLDISLRYHNYAAFLEDISVNGVAIGAGISYDFL